MAGRRKKKDKVKSKATIESASIRGQAFYICESASAGKMNFTLTIDEGKLRDVHVSLDLISCWVDPNTNNTIEAFALLDSSNQGHVDLANCIKSVGMIRVTGASGFVLTGLGDCIRYATKSDAGDYTSDDELYETITFLPSKHSVVMRVLSVLEKYNAVGGFQSANLNLAEDSLLNSVGFFRVEDILGNAPPYWAANVTEIFSYYGSTMEERRDATRMAVLFADKLRRTIERKNNE